ncbi:MAG: hypothetical protein L6V93_19315 [Clostridiales bacterium]|nr:MAG: hypothetical protein L6V93_19315 [Clostridiales bacterium]
MQHRNFLGSSYVGTVDYLVDIFKSRLVQHHNVKFGLRCIGGGKGGHKRCNLYVRRVNRYVPQKSIHIFNGVKFEETAVGASGLYARQVLLREGLNKNSRLRAERQRNSDNAP